MEENNKIYELPQEVIEIFLKQISFEELRNLYVTLPFGFSKAKKCAFEAEKLSQEFWEKCNDIYPSLLSKRKKITKGQRGFILTEEK